MKRKLIIGFSSCLVFMSIVSGILASVAWFAARNKVDLEVTGSFVEAYFHHGTGTADDPFIITRPIHYYHLVEFYQRQTELPSPDVDFGKDYLYFQVGYDLDGNSNTLEVYDYDDQGILKTDSNGNPLTCKTLNMAYYSGDNALMPIGTNEVPFIGVFDGKADKEIVISNLNIHCAERVKVGSNMVDRAASDIGVFGYVSDDDENGGQTIIKNTKIDGLTIDLSNINSTVASSATDIDHLATHETGKPYVGYIAGHIHTYTNYDASGNTPTNASPLYDVYVDNATIKGGANTMCNYGYIGLVDTGDIDNTATISGMVATLAAGAGGGTGQGDNWGGSINIKALNLRFYNMLNVTTNNGIATDDPSTHHPTASTNNTENNITTGKTFLSKPSYSGTVTSSSGANYINQHRYYSDNYNKLSVATYGAGNSSNTKMNNSPLNQVTLYCLEDSRTKTATHRANYTNTTTSTFTTALPGTFLPLNVDTKQNGYEPLHSSEKGYNTGYIIGGQTATTFSNTTAAANQYYGVTTVRTASSSIQYISNSINSTTTFTNSKLEVLTNLNKAYDTGTTAAANFARIQDAYNLNNTSVDPDMAAITSGRANQREILSTSFHSYTGARQSLGNGSDGILDSASYIHGLHFLNGIVNSSAIETGNNIYINSATPLDNYQFPRGSLDFNLKEKGYISFFAGSYQAASYSCDGFFSLYTVRRTTTDSGSTINSIREIDKIYKNPDDATKTEYPHIYKIRSSNTYSTGNSDIALTNQQIAALELEFDCEYIRRDPPLDGAIYYFEIPTNKGEYVIGNADNGTSTGATAGAYLMYLDIAATSGEQQAPTFDQANMISDSPLFTQIGFLKSSENFIINSCFNVAYVIPAGATKDNFSITISCGTETISNVVYTCYEIVIINSTGSNFEISALLIDDDNDPTNTNQNPYLYMYAITYNGGNRTTYQTSDSFTGVSGETTMTSSFHNANANNGD